MTQSQASLIYLSASSTNTTTVTGDADLKVWVRPFSGTCGLNHCGWRDPGISGSVVVPVRNPAASAIVASVNPRFELLEPPAGHYPGCFVADGGSLA